MRWERNEVFLMEFEKLQMIIAEVPGQRLGADLCQSAAGGGSGSGTFLEVFQIIMGMEDTFDVILEEEAVYQVKTVQDLCNLVMIPA